MNDKDFHKAQIIQLQAFIDECPEDPVMVPQLRSRIQGHQEALLKAEDKPYIVREHVEGKAEIGDKRFYVPGYILKGKCPNCKAELDRDFSRDYLSYPIIGVNDTHLYCDGCDVEVPVKVRLNITLEVVE